MRSMVVGLYLILGAIGQFADAAQYVVQEGDTVRDVSQRLGHTPYQLAQMNDLAFQSTEERPPVGLTLTYISDADLDAARMRIEVLAEPLSGEARAPWDELLIACKEGTSRIRYQPNTQGLTWRRVLAFARQWRNAHPSEPIAAP